MLSADLAVLLVGPTGDDRAALVAGLGTPLTPGASEFLAVAPGGQQVRLVVAPGSSELMADAGLRRGLLDAVDGLAVFVPATGRIDAASAALANAASVPVLLVLTHLEHDRADPGDAVEASGALLERELALAQLPVFGTDHRVAAVLDLLGLQVLEPDLPPRPADPEHVEAVADEHEALVGEVLAAAEDEAGLDGYLAGAGPDPGMLAVLLSRAMNEHLLCPVVCLAPGVSGRTPPGGSALLELLASLDRAAEPLWLEQ